MSELLPKYDSAKTIPAMVSYSGIFIANSTKYRPTITEFKRIYKYYINDSQKQQKDAT
ncbi:hypothetical protein [Collimonas humicola]|uniref:hypothetical protein n=1 Tax=Collimonas humicola TaxID=2825886 RepID=UPI001B8C7FE8|nr:hypothetical protein [Collimonas humicola]